MNECLSCRCLDVSLQNPLAAMMPPIQSRSWIAGVLLSGKYVLPAPFSICIGILPFQKPIDLNTSHVQGMPLVVKRNVPLDPLNVGFFCSYALVAQSDGRPNLVEKPWLSLFTIAGQAGAHYATLPSEKERKAPPAGELSREARDKRPRLIDPADHDPRPK